MRLLPFLLALSVLAAVVAGGAQLFNLTEADEIEIGRQASANVDKSQPLLDSKPLTDYLERVGKGLASSTTRPKIPWSFRALNIENVNAFALPGGYLYVTRGLIALTTESSELAAVLSHEMAHVLLNHALERAKVVEQADIVERVATDVLSDPNASQSTRAGSRMTLATFSRNQEIEADRVGITIAGRAGFDPFAAGRFLQSMAAYSEMRSVSGASDPNLDFLASHPNAPQRIELAQRHARQFGALGTGITDRDSFLAGIDGLLFGDTPEEGYVRGNTFLHPGLGISFSVPAGFVIDNSAAAVTATGPGDMAIRFDGVSIDPVEMSPPTSARRTSPELILPVERLPPVAKPTLPFPLTSPTVIDVPDSTTTEKPSAFGVPGPAVMLPRLTAPAASPST